MNHKRCCANDSGNSSTRSRRSIGGALTPAPCRNSRSMLWPNSFTVGRSNNSRSLISTPNTSRTRLITCVASSECPPSSKKFASRPTWATPHTSLQIPANHLSHFPARCSTSYLTFHWRRRGRPLIVNLSAPAQRHPPELHQHLRHHVLRQALA